MFSTFKSQSLCSTLCVYSCGKLRLSVLSSTSEAQLEVQNGEVETRWYLSSFAPPYVKVHFYLYYLASVNSFIPVYCLFFIIYFFSALLSLFSLWEQIISCFFLVYFQFPLNSFRIYFVINIFFLLSSLANELNLVHTFSYFFLNHTLFCYWSL